MVELTAIHRERRRDDPEDARCNPPELVPVIAHQMAAHGVDRAHHELEELVQQGAEGVTDRAAGRPPPWRRAPP